MFSFSSSGMYKLRLLLACIVLYCLSAGLQATICWRNPICVCTGKDKTLINCKNVRNISDVVELLKNHTPVYRIRLQGTFTTIPSRVFDGISVSVLAMASPLTADIPDDSLLGIQNLRTVILNLTQYQTIPDVFANQNYSKFESTRGRLTTISTQLQNMSSATEIRLSKNRISFISPEAFYGTNIVQLLDLSYNDLTHLQRDTFQHMSLLEDIYLQHNQLYTMDGCFSDLNPKIVNLYGNNLTTIDSVLHRGMWNLQYLNVGGNPQMQISSFAFNSSMKSLNEIHLSNNGYTRMDPYLIKNLWKLRKLYLNGNDFAYLPRYFLERNPFLSVLELSNNRLRSVEESLGNHREWYNSMKVMLDGNKMQSVAFGRRPLSIYHLDISRNQINSIRAEDMVALRKVKFLNLSANGLSSLDNKSFQNFYSLDTLDLSNNYLTNLNGSLQGLSKLYYLYLSFSSLEHLSEDEFLGVQRVKAIFLRNNSLHTVHGAFRRMKYINLLDVSMNNLTTLTADSFPSFKKISIRVRVLWMAGNPWTCDCRLAWMANWVRRQGSRLMDEPICSSPDHLQNQTLRSLNLTDYERWLEGCPEVCVCICRTEGNLIYTEANCIGRGLSEVPKVLPSNARSLDLRGNIIESFDDDDVLGFEHLERLNLENNKIEKVRLALPPKLYSLRLASNSLRTFPLDEWVTVNASIREISLSRNPWTCNCDTWPFRNWLVQHNDSVLDVNQVRCSSEESFHLRDKPIISLTREDLCSLLSNVIILSVCSAFLLITCLLCFCYRHSLAALFYSWGCTCLKRAETHEYPYDAFLMYSEDDEQFALGELAIGLEGGRHPFNLCIPTRDIPSPRTPQKINAYLPQCTKVIVLLTRPFVENRQCMRLLISAMSFSTESSAQCIIFVTRGELPPAQELDSVLTTLMRSCKLLRWGQRLFWQKLIYQMPKRGTKKEYYDDVEEEPFLRS